jgi:hypothetical protein
MHKKIKSRSSKLRPLAIFAGLLAVLVVAILVGISVWFGSYIRSEEFRARLAEKTGTAFDASAGFSPLRWTGASAYAESATLKGSPSSSLKNLNAREIRAEVNWRAAFSGSWRVEEITITHLEGEWQKPDKSQVPPPSAKGISAIPEVLPSGIIALLPQKFELGILNVDNATLRVGRAELANTSLSVKPDGTGWLFQGKHGRFTSPWAPGLDVTDFRVREQGKDFFLTQGNLRLGPNGRIVLSGESASGGNLRVSWEGISSSEVLQGEWSSRLQGILSGSAILAAPDVCKGSVTLRDGRLENIPILATIADFTQNPAFRRMPLQEVRGDFAWDTGKWRITNFAAESKGLLRIEGAIVVGQGGALEGDLQIGVTHQTLQWLPGSRERVFTKSHDGYLWADMRVGGTLEKPTENLSERLRSAMSGELIQRGSELIQKTPDSAIEGVKSVLDILRPFAP